MSVIKPAVSPHRFIGENVTLLRDVVHFANDADLPLPILSFDEEKVFERVHWPFLRSTLSRMGFIQSYIKWVVLLYSDIRSSILINGYTSPYFLGGVREGWPLSRLFYVLKTEVLVVNIRVHPAMKGLMVPPASVPLPVWSLYADDTAVIS